MKLKKIKSLIKSFDLFSKPVTLRYSGQPCYESFEGGLCSIILIVVFIAVFTGTMINTLKKSNIYSTVTRFEEIDPTYYTMGTDSFIFAVGLSGINVNQGDRWFDIELQARAYTAQNKGKRTIALSKCERQQWTRINSNFSQFYDRLKLQQWLCPPTHLTMQLQGKFTSQIFKFYKIGVKQCKPSLDPTRPCVSSTQIQSYLNASQSFSLNFYYVNTILNPENQQYISYYIDDFNYFPFTPKTGCNVNLYLSSYNVQTDESIYPFEQMRNQSGGIVLANAQVLNYEVRGTEYLKFNLRKSSLSLSIFRSYRKLDDTISYIGGLFSAILSLLVLMGLYNQFSFQLQIAQNLYKYDKAQPIDSDKFNILTFLGYLVFLLCHKVGIKLPWPRMKMYHRSLQEVRKQIDIRFLFKKLQYVENATGSVMDENQLKVLHLHDNLTLEEAETIRKDYQFYEKLEKYYLQFSTEEDLNNAVKNSESGSETSPKNMHPTQPNQLIPVGLSNNNPTKVTPTNSNPISISNSFETVHKSNIVMNQSDQIIQQLQQQQKPKTDKNEAQIIELRNMVMELKECIKVLRKESEEGVMISRRILGNVDEELIKKLEMENIEEKFEETGESLQIMNNQCPKLGESLPQIILTREKSFKQRRLNSRKMDNQQKKLEPLPQPILFRRQQPKTIHNLQLNYSINQK